MKSEREKNIEKSEIYQTDVIWRLIRESNYRMKQKARLQFSIFQFN
jgi:hypothetical protein